MGAMVSNGKPEIPAKYLKLTSKQTTSSGMMTPASQASLTGLHTTKVYRSTSIKVLRRQLQMESSRSQALSDSPIWTGKFGFFLGYHEKSIPTMFCTNASHHRDGKDDYAYIDQEGAIWLWWNRGSSDSSMTIDGLRFADMDGSGVRYLRSSLMY
jgi:hypothetical protein